MALKMITSVRAGVLNSKLSLLFTAKPTDQ